MIQLTNTNMTHIPRPEDPVIVHCDTDTDTMTTKLRSQEIQIPSPSDDCLPIHSDRVSMDQHARRQRVSMYIRQMIHKVPHRDESSFPAHEFIALREAKHTPVFELVVAFAPIIGWPVTRRRAWPIRLRDVEVALGEERATVLQQEVVVLADFVGDVDVGGGAVGDMIADFEGTFGTLPVEICASKGFQFASVLFAEVSPLDHGDSATVSTVADPQCAGTEMAEFCRLEIFG